MTSRYRDTVKIQRIMWWTATVTGVAVLATGLASVLTSPESEIVKRPARAAIVPAPLAVTMTILNTGGKAAMGSRITVAVEALGEDVQSLTLWDDDDQVASWTNETTAAGVGHTFEWQAIRPGPHTLFATAEGSDGIAYSAPIPMEVFITSTTPKVLLVESAAGATVESVASAAGISTRHVAALGEVENNGGAGDLVEPGNRQRFSIDAVAVAAEVAASLEGSSADTATETATDTSTTTNSTTTSTAASPPSPEAPSQPAPPAPSPEAPSEPVPPAPTSTLPPPPAPVAPSAGAELKASRSKCVISVKAPNNEGDLVLYHAGGGSIAFVEVGTIKGAKSLRLENLGPGSHIFVAGPQGKPANSAPVSAVLPTTCVQSWWSGNATLINGILTIPETTSTPLWAYLSVDGKPAIRMPRDSSKNWTADARRISASSELPTLIGTSLHLEVWSETPEKGAFKIASGDATLPEGVSPETLIGESAVSTVSVTPAAAKLANEEFTATWETAAARADHVLWQITTQPLSPGSTSLNPPGLVASGISQATSATPSSSMMHGGQFKIPVKDLVRPPMELIAPQPLALQELGSVQSVSNMPTKVPKVIADPSAIDLSSGPLAEPELVGLTFGAQISGNTYFLRVIPFEGASPLGGASNAARFDLPEATDPPVVSMTTSTVEFNAGRAPNYALRGCVRVTSIPWDSSAPSESGLNGEFYSKFFSSAGTYCPGDWDSAESCWTSEALCDAWDGVVAGVSWVIEQASAVWDLIASAYNGIIDLAVTLIAKFNPYCIQAAVAAAASNAIGFKPGEAVATSANDLCEKVGRVVARAAISAVLAVVGLPPALPTSDQLKAIAQGNLTELAVAFLDQLGVPCSSLTIDADSAAVVSAAATASGESLPPGTEDGVDVCRDAVSYALDQVAGQIKAQTQSQIAASTGLPLPAGPIDGFDFIMEPRGHYQGPSVQLIAAPTSTDGSVSAKSVCYANAVTTLQKYQAGPKDKPVFGSVPLLVKQSWPPGVWGASAKIPFNPATGYDALDFNLSAGVVVSTQISSSCLNGGKDTFVTSEITPGLGRWSPGQKD